MNRTYSIIGMTCTGCQAKVKYLLEEHPDITTAEIDLENHTGNLEMDKHVPTTDLQNLIGGDGKYTISEREAATPTSIQEERSWFATYKPLLLIFVFIAMVSGIGSTSAGEVNLMLWMNYFMAGFFIVFSFFKFLDLKAFAETYAMYDLLAKQVKGYGYLYPFIELALGLAYLTSFEPYFTNLATIVVMGFSSIGVIQSVLSKTKIRCACLGAVFNLPMTTVTIIEDLLMVAMAGFMLLQ